jgi:hypothetical protein
LSRAAVVKDVALKVSVQKNRTTIVHVTVFGSEGLGAEDDIE